MTNGSSLKTVLAVAAAVVFISALLGVRATVAPSAAVQTPSSTSDRETFVGT